MRKGFLIHDLENEIPNKNVFGLDISNYAKQNSIENIRNKISIGSCDNLPYDDNFFDLSICINTIHNLNYEGCKKSLLELKELQK